jgi:probable HAF family extracellular repeat protein
MTDLGTLGGFHSEAQAMNDGGQVAGWSMTASGARHAALWTVPRPPAAQYPIRVLGSPPGYSFTVATAVNDAGQVALHGMSAPDRFRPFLWENGSFTDLGTVGGGNESFAQGINNAGQVVGWGYTSSGLSHAFLWENGTMTDLGVSLDRESAAYGINGAGQVVGSKANASGNSHAFLWYQGTIRDLGTLGGPFSDASAVNDAGQVIGWSAADASLANHAFLWENGTMTDLGIGTLGAAAYAINNGGQVVGSYTDGSRQEHAFLWQNGTTTDLGFWTPSAINDAGQIVGSRQSNTSDTRAVLWQNGIISDLGAAPGDSDSQAYGINNAGQVVGTSWRKSDGIRRAVLWTVPLPAIHDVAVMSASASPAFADVGTQVTIAARVSNQGTRPETFQVSAYAGPNLVGTTAVTDLAAGAARGVSFTWDTSSATAGSYRTRVEAAFVYNETNLGNNVHAAGTVLLSLPAKALASGTPSTTDVDIAISFHCAAMDGTPPFAFSWDFGDNTTGVGETASHAYARPGTMIAVCTVRDGSGNLASSSVTVVVSFAPSVVAAVNREAASPNYVLMFSARATGGSGGLTYAWDFGDRSSGTGNPITHAYATAGEYTASLTVRDTAGGTASSSVTVGISNVAVTATPTTTAAATGDGLTFTASAAGGAGGPFSFAWDFGDGTNATGASVTHAYSRPGSYTPRVTVTDASGTVQEKVLATITVRSGANPTNPTTTAAFAPGFIEGGAIVALAAVVIALYAIRRRPPER